MPLKRKLNKITATGFRAKDSTKGWPIPGPVTGLHILERTGKQASAACKSGRTARAIPAPVNPQVGSVARELPANRRQLTRLIVQQITRYAPAPLRLRGFSRFCADNSDHRLLHLHWCHLLTHFAHRSAHRCRTMLAQHLLPSTDSVRKIAADHGMNRSGAALRSAVARCSHSCALAARRRR